MVQSARHHPLCASGRLTLWLSNNQMNSGHRDRSFSFNNNWGDAHLWQLRVTAVRLGGMRWYSAVRTAGLPAKGYTYPTRNSAFHTRIIHKRFHFGPGVSVSLRCLNNVHFGFVNFLNRLQQVQRQMCGPCNPVFWNRCMKQHIFLSLHHQFLLKPEREDTYFYTGPAWGHR